MKALLRMFLLRIFIVTVALCSAVQGTVGALEDSATALFPVVDCNAGGDLGAAILSAPIGSTLAVTGRCTGPFVVAKALVLRGVARSGVQAALDGASMGSALTVTESGDLTLIDMTVTGGTGTPVGPPPATLSGGGILNRGTVELRYVNVRANSLSATEVASVGSAQGAGIWNGGTLRLDHSRVTLNAARALGNDGGGLWNQGQAALLDSTVTENQANGLSGRGGGVANAAGATLTLRRSRIDANTASGRTGGGAGLSNRGRATLEASAVTANVQGGFSVVGGGIDNSGELLLRRVELSENLVSGSVGVSGGGLYNRGTVTLEAARIVNNEAVGTMQPGSGGGIFNNAPADSRFSILRSVIMANKPTDCLPAALCTALHAAGAGADLFRID